MNCPKCSTVMAERQGKFGVFLFCTKQTKCGQSTITKVDTVRLSYRATAAHNNPDTFRPHNTGWSPESEPNELGDSFDSVNNEGDWFRPY